MKRILNLLSGIALLNTARYINQPPPSTLALWERPGTNQPMIQQALLKCG